MHHIEGITLFLMYINISVLGNIVLYLSFMIVTVNELTISSFNCWGAMSSIKYIDSLLKNTDILCIQEHHLYPDCKGFLEKYDQAFKAFVRCDSGLSTDDVPRVRKGGIAMMWRTELDYCVTRMEDIGSDRIMVIKISVNNCEPMYIMNVYMPSTNSHIEVYREVLSELRAIHEYLSIRGMVIIVGDFNGQLGPSGGPRCPMPPSHRGSILLGYISEFDLVPLICHNSCTGPLATFYPHNGGPGTQIDHIFIENRYMRFMKSCMVSSDNINNTSDHVPIMVKVVCKIQRYAQKTRSVYRWDKCNPDTYSKCLDYLITQNSILNGPIECENNISEYANELQYCMKEAADRVVPMSKFYPYKKPYWDDELKLVQKDQWEKREKWISEGRPRGMNFESYRIYKQAKRKYTNMYRLKVELFEQEKLEELSCSCDNDVTSFWKHVRSQKEPIITMHSIRDGDKIYSSPEELLCMWSDHYHKLLNEQEEEEKLYDQEFKEYIDTQIEFISANMSREDDSMGIFDTDFSVVEIQEVSRELPNGKSPGFDLIVYENIKYGGTALHKCIVILFNSIVKYVSIPDFYKYGLLISGHKGKRKLRDDKDSYRGITLMPCMNKLLEKCVWKRLWPWLKNIGFPNPLQHACCPGCSSVVLSFVLQESIHYHIERGGKVFACFLDSEKAFDKVWWNGLLFKLYNMGVRDKMWFLIKEWLHGSTCSVLVNGMTSQPFEITRSIKQGGMLSMFLYVAYISDFHTFVNSNGSGLNVYDINVSSPTIADDSALLSNTKKGLDDMMYLAYLYGILWRIAFSQIKTKCAVFEKSKQQGIVYKWCMDEKEIEQVDQFVHVGIRLSCSFKSKTRTHEMCNKGKSQIGAMSGVGVRGDGLNPLTSAHIWEKVTLPSILYGAELWNNLTKGEIDELEKVQKFAAKRIQGFDKRTHDEIVRRCLEWNTMNSIIDYKKLMFLHKLIFLDESTIAKQLFLYRLYDYMLGVQTQGFVPDIVNILKRYDLTDALYTYTVGGQFMDKIPWKFTVRNQIESVERDIWENSLKQKGDTVYACEVLTDQHENLYKLAKRHPKYRFQIQSIVKVCTYPILNEQIPCALCDDYIDDRIQHLICNCNVLNVPRNHMWDEITDVLGTNLSSELYNMDDKQMICILLGQSWKAMNEYIEQNEDISKSLYDEYIIVVAKFLHIVYKTIRKMIHYN